MADFIVGRPPKVVPIIADHIPNPDKTPTVGELGAKLGKWITDHPFESLAFGVLGAIALTAGRRR